MISQIEDAILDRIADAAGLGAGKLGYMLPTIRSYGGELDEQIKTTVINYPAVWLALADDEMAHDQGAVQIWRPTFMVIAAARSLRNEQARRHGGPAGEVGAYQLIMDIRALLSGQSLGLDIDPLIPQRIEAVHHGALRSQAVAIYSLKLTTAYVLPVAPDQDAIATDDFTVMAADWAGPGDIVATDTLTLEQP